MNKILALLFLVLPTLAFGQTPPPLRTIQVNGAATSPAWPTLNLVGSGVSASNDNAHKRTNITFDSGGGGGGGGAATSFEFGPPSSPSSGGVWYDIGLGTFCGSWFDGSDCFARLGPNIFTGAQKLRAASVSVGVRSSPVFTLEGQAWDGSASQPAAVTMQSTPQSATIGGFTLSLGQSLFTIYDNPSLTSIGCGSGGGSCRITGYSSFFSVPSIQFGTNTTYTAGNDIYTWRNGSSTLMRLQDDGVHKGMLLGLTSIAGLVPPAAGNSGFFLRSDGSVWSSFAGPVTLNVLNYGAKCDAPQDGSGGGTDDTAAFQAWLTALQNTKGGRGVIPPGKCRVKGPLTFDVGGGVSYNHFEIDATGAIIWADYATNHQTWFSISNAFMNIRGLTLMGWNGAYPPSVPTNTPIKVFALSASEVHFADCLFTGIRLDQAPLSNDTTGGVIAADASSLVLDGVRMESIIGTSITPMINARRWHHVGIRGLKSSDFFTWNNQSGSLGQGTSPMVVIGKPHYDTRSAPVARNGHVYIEHSNFDEGQGSILIGGYMQTDGFVHDLVATLQANFTMPTFASNVVMQVNETLWMEPNDLLYVPVAGWMRVVAVVDATHVRVSNSDSSNTGLNGNAAAGTNIPFAGGPIVRGQGPLSARIDDIDMNHGQHTTPLIDLHGVMHATVRNVFGRQDGSAAVKARYCNSLLVEGWETRYDDRGQMRTVDINSTNDLVVFRDADLDTSTSTALQNIVDKAGSRSLAAYTTAARPSASGRAGTPIWDTTIEHVLVSNGSSWIDLTAGGGGGGVTSVGLAMPGIFSVSGSPVTSTGTLTATLNTQAANMVWSGPTTGAAAAPTFRPLVVADVPDLSSTYAIIAGSYSNPSWITTLAATKLSGLTATSNGGTGLNTSGCTGVPMINGGTWTCSSAYQRTQQLSSGTTGAGTTSITWALPSGLNSNNTNACTFAVESLVKQASVGGGTITFTCGVSGAGSSELILSQTTAGAAAGTWYGKTIAQLGAKCTTVGDFKQCVVDGASTITCTTVVAGTISTQEILQITVSGYCS